MLKEDVFEIVKSVPEGKVITYGKIAEMLGDKKLARAVGNALHQNTDKHGIPCYRVVNSKGMLSDSYVFGGISEQRRMLEADGIKTENNRVDLTLYKV